MSKEFSQSAACYAWKLKPARKAKAKTFEECRNISGGIRSFNISHDYDATITLLEYTLDRTGRMNSPVPAVREYAWSEYNKIIGVAPVAPVVEVPTVVCGVPVDSAFVAQAVATFKEAVAPRKRSAETVAKWKATIAAKKAQANTPVAIEAEKHTDSIIEASLKKMEAAFVQGCAIEPVAVEVVAVAVQADSQDAALVEIAALRAAIVALTDTVKALTTMPAAPILRKSLVARKSDSVVRSAVSSALNMRAPSKLAAQEAREPVMDCTARAALKPSIRFWHKGDACEYTGKEQALHGGLCYEYRTVDSGKLGWTYRMPPADSAKSAVTLALKLKALDKTPHELYLVEPAEQLARRSGSWHAYFSRPVPVRAEYSDRGTRMLYVRDLVRDEVFPVTPYCLKRFYQLTTKQLASAHPITVKDSPHVVTD